MPIYDLTEFFRLSSVLNYNLSAATLNRYNVLSFILEGKRLDKSDAKDREIKNMLMGALGYLFSAYHQKRRRLGPLAVLHPLRATALFAKAFEKPDWVSLVVALFHDILEEVHAVDYEGPLWREMESTLFGLLERMGNEAEQRVTHYMVCLTRLDSESYYQYIGRLLKYAEPAPDLLQIKLADRLDNTLDMRIELQDPLVKTNLFQHMFQLLFVNNYPGYQPDAQHQPTQILNGARRLYQLFKNAVLLSLIRQKIAEPPDSPLETLLTAVADASMKEAQRNILHLLGYHYRDLSAQRDLVLDVMAYCYEGRSDVVTVPDSAHRIDGLFSTYFAHTDRKILNQQLDLLYQDKALMIQASVAFMVIFLSFLNDSSYFVRGISAAGIVPT